MEKMKIRASFSAAAIRVVVLCFKRAQAHAFSCSRDDPTASSVVLHGEALAAASVDGLDWPYAPVRWLLREKLPQFPALPALTCPFARPPPPLEVLLSPSANGECPDAGGDGVKSSDPLNECRTFELFEGVGAFVVRCKKQK
jgi:hypothetical protein